MCIAPFMAKYSLALIVEREELKYFSEWNISAYNSMMRIESNMRQRYSIGFKLRAFNLSLMHFPL